MNYDSMPLKRVRGLSLTRPWPWAFDNGPIHKRIENRSWKAPASIISTHKVALHAAKSWCEYDREFISKVTELDCPPRDQHPDSILFAVCDITRCFEYERAFGSSHQRIREREAIPQDIWAFGEWCWVVENYVKLIEPVPCKGAQGLWGFEKKQTELAMLRDVYANSLTSVLKEN